MIAIFLTALTTWAWVTSPRKWIWFYGAMTMTCLCLLGLSQTYSRGGWVAYAAGWLFFTLALDRGRRIPAVIFFGFVLILFLLPHGAARAASMMEIEEDRSIAHRLLVWKGALTMAADHPLTGVGKGRFGREFTAWYQPLEMNTRYLAALNNSLTLAAERGFGILWFYLALLTVPFICASWLAWKRKNLIILGAASAQVVHFISGQFTYSISFRHVSGLFAFFYLATFAYCMWRLWREKISRMPCFRWSAGVITLTGCLSLLLWWYGASLLGTMSARVENLSVASGGGLLPGVLVRPQGQAIKGGIVYFHEKGESVIENGKQLLRPWAERGYVVCAFDYRAGGRDGLADALNILREVAERMPSRFFLAGLGVGGRMAFLVACHPDLSPKAAGIVCVNMRGDWPFPDLSPLRQIEKLSSPVLLIHGGSNQSVPSSEIEMLSNVAQSYGIPCKMVVVPSLTHYPAETWPKLLNEVDLFFQHLK